MGPGARPVGSGDAQSRPRSPAQIVEERKTFSFNIGEESLNIGYEINGANRSYQLPYVAIPLHGFKKWYLFGGPKRAFVPGTTLISSIKTAEEIAKRPLTQTEAEGFAMYTIDRTMSAAWGQIAGLTAGGAIAYRSREQMKFPFRKPKPLERYNNFPNRYVPVLRGQFARAAWQITRAGIYGFLFTLIIGPFFGTWGAVTATTGLARDERTKDVMMEMKPYLDRAKGDRARGSQEGRNQVRPQPQPQSQSQESGQYSDPAPQEHYRNSSQGGTNDYWGDRDHSRDNAYSEGTTDTGTWSDPSTSPDGRNSLASTPQSQSQRYHEERSPPSSSGDFFDDDASPTAGNDADMSTPEPYQGSAWGRIRRGNTSSKREYDQARQVLARRDVSEEDRLAAIGTVTGQIKDNITELNRRVMASSSRLPTQQPARQQRQQSSRPQSQEQAQKDFDELLEQERKQSGSDEYDRGMRAVESGQESAANSGMSAWERRRGR